MDSETAAKTLFTVESTAPFIEFDHNKRFFAKETLLFDSDELGSQLSTTDTNDEEESPETPAVATHFKTCLRFTVDDVASRTIFFGDKRESCDVLIFPDNPNGKTLFAVEMRNETGYSVMLKNLSGLGLEIQSPFYENLRFKGTRCLHPGDPVTVFLPGLTLQIQCPVHQTRDPEYLRQLLLFHARLHNAPPTINKLALDSVPISSPFRAKNHYHLEDELGRGAFGTVYKARDSLRGNVVAVKVYKDGQSLPLHEAMIMQRLSHPNIVRFVDFLSPGMGSGKPTMLVMELIDHPNLRKVRRARPFSLDMTKDLIGELLHTLVYLHARGFTHRDLKPENIIVTSLMPLKIKLTDLGLTVTRVDDLTTACGTSLYVAPEIWSGRYTHKVDIWAVGVIALELDLGLPVYPEAGPQTWPDVLADWMEGLSMDPLLASFVVSLLSKKADDRPSAAECLTHPFLQVEHDLEGPECPTECPGSPTEYAPTPTPSRIQLVDISGQPESSVAAAARCRSANAPSPSEHGLEDSKQTQFFSPHPEIPPLSPPEPAPEVSFSTASLPPAPSVYITKQSDITYWKLKHAGATVMYKPDSKTVNITHVLKAIRYYKKVSWDEVGKQVGGFQKIVIQGPRIGGTYVPLHDAQRILRHLQIPTASLQDLRGQIQAGQQGFK